MAKIVKLAAIGLRASTDRGVGHVVIPAYFPLPATGRYQSWVIHEHDSSLELSLYGQESNANLINLGQWHISGIPLAPKGKSNVTMFIRVDEQGAIAVGATWQDQALTVAPDKMGATARLPVYQLPAEVLAASEQKGKLRGVVKMYTIYQNYGEVRTSLGGREFTVPFAKPPERDSGLRLFDAGDEVVFDVRDGQVINVTLVKPIAPHYNQFWCSACQRCLGYGEVIDEYCDTTWGEGRQFTCKTCHANVWPGSCEEKA